MAVISGTAASETINGTESDDEIFGRGGDDILNGLGGDDVFRWFSDEGNDTINGGDGRDRSVVTFTNNTGNANQTFSLTADGSNSVFQFGVAGSQANPLTTVNTMSNVEDFQLRFTPGLALSPTVRIGNLSGTGMTGTIQVTQLGDENLTVEATEAVNNIQAIGGAGADRFLGGEGIDEFYGYGGNDLFSGGAGNDTYVGGQGDDTYIASGGDSVIEEAGAGNDAVVTPDDQYTLRENLENLFYNGTGNFTGVGNELGNFMQGGAGNDYLIGLDGNDTLYGVGGDDTLQGGTGDDLYIIEDDRDTVVEFAGEGTDTVQTTLRSYTLSENLENLRFIGTESTVGQGNASNNVLAGGSGRDTLYGAAGNDTIEGNDGADILRGDAGDDAITGGLGPDELAGGTGADRFIYTQVEDRDDLILDFSRDEGDRIDLSAVLDSVGAGSGDPFASGHVRLEDTTFGGQPATTVFFDADGSAGPGGEVTYITVLGQVPLQQGDFIV